jgi:NADPH:quinone reductase-like Zn-dependent oxidoreductase
VRAAVYAQPGPPDVLVVQERPDPIPGPGERLFEVAYSGVNPVDAKIRSGAYPRDGTRFPAVPGVDFSGHDPDSGAPVFGMSWNGTAAERVAAGGQGVVPVPVGTDLADAAGMPAATLTAWQALFVHGGLQGHHRVLIHAAAGGVGGYAVQLARHKGAYIIGTCRAANADYVRGLGANETVDYREVDFRHVVRDVDLVLDLVGGAVTNQSFDVLKYGGRLISIVQPPDQDLAQAKGATAEYFSMQVVGAQLTQIAELVADGIVRPVDKKIMPLADIVEAHRMIETGATRGKIILEI